MCEEYWQQALSNGKLALTAAGQDVNRLAKLIEIANYLPAPIFDQLMDALSSLTMSGLSEKQKLLLWNEMTRTTRIHRLYSRAEWSLPDDLINRIEEVAERFAPTNLYDKLQHLFTGRDWDLVECNEEFEEQREKIEARRLKAITEILQQCGIEGVIRFAEQVLSSRDVGRVLAAVTNESIDQTLLPCFLDSKEIMHKEFVRGFIWKRHCDNGWKWSDSVDRANWTCEQIGIFLTCLPFANETWNRATEWLNGNQGEYWKRVDAYAFQSDGGLNVAIEKLLEHDRLNASIECLNNLRIGGKQIDVVLCIRVLLKVVTSNESLNVEDYVITELIKLLQSELSVEHEDLFKVEWTYLQLLSSSRSGSRPRHLEFKLSTDPEFFCELIRLIYRSKHTERQSQQECDPETRSQAENAWHLLRVWQTPPGTQKDETFSEDKFTEWLQSVTKSCMESGHLDIALSNIGEVLIHVPPEPNGLWINRSVAIALNQEDAEEMRLGFRVGMYNSRGAHTVDSSGKQERELANQIRDKAETMENSGFFRLATTLRRLAESYKKEANQMVGE